MIFEILASPQNVQLCEREHWTLNLRADDAEEPCDDDKLLVKDLKIDQSAMSEKRLE